MLNLLLILEPTWLHFGRVLAPKIHPNWHRIALKIDSENDHKNDSLLDRLKIDFWWIWGPNLAPKKGNRSLDFGAFWLLGPSWGQDGPKTPPRGPRGPILDDFGPHLGGFLVPTWWIWGGFWTPSWLIFGVVG